MESQNSLFKQIIYNLDRNAEKDILEICYSFLRKTDGDTFSNFMGIYISSNMSMQKIRENANDILSSQIIRELLKYFMFLFREIYADVAFLLLTSISRDMYERAFKESMPFLSDMNSDYERTVRVSIVAKVLARLGNKEWDKACDEMPGDFVENTQINSTNIESKNSEYCDIIYTNTIEGELVEYFDQCAEQLSKTIAKKTGLEEFRKAINIILTTPREDTLLQVLSGTKLNDLCKKEDEIVE